MDAKTSLLDVVRNRLGLDAASRGCRDGSCGACRMLLDGALVNACQVAWSDVPHEARVEAYEDLESDPEADRVARAFATDRPTRCHMCTPALAVTAVSLARRGVARDPRAIDDTLRTATCVCTGRGSWRRALLG